jgi:hypothetical protein
MKDNREICECRDPLQAFDKNTGACEGARLGGNAGWHWESRAQHVRARQFVIGPACHADCSKAVIGGLCKDCPNGSKFNPDKRDCSFCDPGYYYDSREGSCGEDRIPLPPCAPLSNFLPVRRSRKAGTACSQGPKCSFAAAAACGLPDRLLHSSKWPALRAVWGRHKHISSATGQRLEHLRLFKPSGEFFARGRDLHRCVHPAGTSKQPCNIEHTPWPCWRSTACACACFPCILERAERQAAHLVPAQYIVQRQPMKSWAIVSSVTKVPGESKMPNSITTNSSAGALQITIGIQAARLILTSAVSALVHVERIPLPMCSPCQTKCPRASIVLPTAVPAANCTADQYFANERCSPCPTEHTIKGQSLFDKCACAKGFVWITTSCGKLGAPPLKYRAGPAVRPACEAWGTRHSIRALTLLSHCLHAVPQDSIPPPPPMLCPPLPGEGERYWYDGECRPCGEGTSKATEDGTGCYCTSPNVKFNNATGACPSEHW